MPNIDHEIYWQNQRRKGHAFENAAEEAKREMFPELFFSDFEPSLPICRVCKNTGYHLENCELRHPDGKDTAKVEDLIRIAPDAEKVTKSSVEIERERLQKLNDAPVKVTETVDKG